MRRASTTVVASADNWAPSYGDQRSFHGGLAGEEVQHGAVRVDGLREFAVALSRLRAGGRDRQADAGEARAHLVVEAEEPVQVEIALGRDLDVLERDPELRRPHAVGDRLAR